MIVVRLRVPPSALGKARLAGMVFGVIDLLAQLGNLGNPARPPEWRFVSAAGLLLLIGAMATTTIRRRPFLLEPLLVPVLVVVVGSGLVDSVATFGVCIGAAVAQSMYGSHRGWALRTVLLCAAFLSAVAVSPYSIGGRWISWHSPTLIAMVPQLLMLSVLVRGLYYSLLHQYQASERDATLARTGSQLIGATDLEQVHVAAVAASVRLSELSPGTVTVVLEQVPDGLVVVHCVGFPDALLHTVLSAEVVRALDPTDSETVHTLVTGVEELQAYAPNVRHWRGVGLAVADTARYLLVGGERRVSGDVVNAFRNLGHQITFAEASCRSHLTLDHKANHDNLTTLPNRGQFFKRLGAAIDEAVQTTLLVIDLDDFKRVNDTYGHGAGDELLIEVAARLTEVGGGNAVAARFGGDEFALLLTDAGDDAAVVAQRLCQRLMEPMRLTTATVTIGASIGVATAAPGLTAGDLMRCADIAMYSAKARGKNRVEVFDPDQHGDVAKPRLLEEHLAHAVDRDEIVLQYQPYFELGSDRCVGVEATVRWEHSTLGPVPPADFIAVAHRAGLISALSAYILRTACHNVAQLSTPPGSAELRLAIDVTSPQLLDPTFPAIVRQAIEETGLDAARICVGIAGSAQLHETAVQQRLHELAEIGVRIALDDFGVREASLATLRSLPISQISIRPDLVTSGDGRLHTDEGLRLIVAIADILGLDTVASGVDTAEQAAHLRSANITHAHGLHFAASAAIAPGADPIRLQESLDGR